MNTYKVITTEVSGRGSRIHQYGAQVTDNDFLPGMAEKLMRLGFLQRTKTGPPPVIGVVIPTRGNRPIFLQQAKYLLMKQTKQPDHIEIVDYAPKSDKVDLCERYKTGCQTLFDKGCNAVLFWEDDDYYAYNYIEQVIFHWVAQGKPELFGIAETFYYHVFANRYLQMKHPRRASAFCTLVTESFLDLPLDPNDPYIDTKIWQKVNGKTFVPRQIIALGIKHGQGMVAGGAHNEDSEYYTKEDPGKNFLRSVTGNDFKFYDLVNLFTYEKEPCLLEKPFLSIITRIYKRPFMLLTNKESLLKLKNKAFEQIFVSDNVGQGMLEANKAFGNVVDMIDGKYVFFLDDDDLVTNPDMIDDLEAVAKEHDPDVIFFRMIIKNNMNGNYYPTASCWENKPMIAHIGGSCFVVKKEIYKKFIHNFAYPRCGDFYFINAVFESGAKCYWLDKLMCETGIVSYGKPESVK